MHVHLSKHLELSEWAWKQWPGTSLDELTAEQYLQKMNSSTPIIDKTVVFGSRSLNSETPSAMKSDNDYILETVEKFPDRYIGAALIDPSWGKKSTEELNRAVKNGLRLVKIKFTSVQYPANCIGSQRLMREVEDLGVLPLIHSDWTHWSNPSIIGSLASYFPDLSMVMQHFGLSQSNEAIDVAKKNENIYIDTSATIYPREILRFIKNVDVNRVLFASDTIRNWEKNQPQEEINRVKDLDLEPEKEKKIFGENASKLLKSVGVKL